MSLNRPDNFTTLHEGFFKDIVDLVVGEKGKDNSIVDRVTDLINKTYNNSSDNEQFEKNIGRNIAKAAKGLTAVFPVVVTEATPLDQAVMISKVIEKKCVSMLQMLFAAGQISNAKNAINYLSKFHNNLSDEFDLSSANIDDVIKYSNSMADKNAFGENAIIQAEIMDGIKAVQEDVKNNCGYYLDECINPNSINNYRVRTVFNEINISNTTRSTQRDTRNTDHSNPEATTSTSDKTTDSINTGDLKSAFEVLNRSVVRSDIDKANEAMPSMMIVYFTNEETKLNSVCIIGVKAMIHYVSSADMMDKVILKNSDRRGLFNFIRATTREISFFKDFLFSVDRAKVDALSKTGKGSTSNIWKMLELRANTAKRNRSVGKNDASCSAIATIVISRAEADIIKKEHRVDITKPNTLLSIMRGYSFMCAAIVDETSERVDFLWDDGTKRFDTYSFMSLEREESSGMYKKVINLMTKGGRR